MDQRDSRKRILVACRYVPYDQWLITHLDTSWTIDQAKQWILSRCNLGHTPDLPRYRPLSPITFASKGARRSKGSTGTSNDDEDNGEESADNEFDGELGSGGEGSSYLDDDDLSEGMSSHDIQSPPPRSKSFTDAWQARLQRKSESSTSAVSASSVTLPSAHYTLVSFSTNYMLEDDFRLSFYALRPYELLELHPARHIIRLPRETLTQYVQPYFEARIRALRSVAKDDVSDGLFGLLGGGGKNRGLNIKIGKGMGILYNSEPGAATDYGRQQGWDKEQERDKNEKDKERKEKERREKERQKKKRKMEWRDRWVCIHQGVLRLCQDRSDASTPRAFPLSSLLAIRGAEHISNSSVPNVAAGQRIICAKFRLGGDAPKPPPTPAREKTPSASKSSPPSGRQSYHHYRPLPADQQQQQKQQHKFPKSVDRGTQASSASSSPASTFPEMQPSPMKSRANTSTSTGPQAKYAGSGNPDWLRERDTGMGMGTGMAMGFWDIAGADRSRSTSTTASVSTSRSVSIGADISEMDGEGEEGWEKVEKAKAKKAEDGEWIVMELCDDSAFTSMLRILHRHAPRPISSAFLPRSSTVISNTSSANTSNTSGTNASSSLPRSVHFPATPGTSPISFSSPFGPTSPGPTSAEPSTRSPPAAPPTSGGDFIFGMGYLAPSGAQHYPEWRMELVDRARKIGVGDVGKAMEWVMWGKDEGQGDEEVKGEPGKGKGKEEGEGEDTEDGGWVRRRRRDTIGTMASVASDGTVGPAESFISSSGVSRRSTGIGRGDGVADDDEEVLSDVEWEGWMRDLDRQSKVEKEAQRRKEHKDREARQLAVDASDRTISNQSSTDSLRPRPRALTLTILAPTSPTTASVSSFTRCPDTPSTPSGILTVSTSPGSATGSPAISPVRRRSSTVTAANMGSRLLRKKDKGKEKEKEKEPPPPLPEFPADFVRTASAKPRLTLALSGTVGSSTCPPSAVAEEDATCVPPSDPHPRRTALLRHVRSASNMQRGLRGDRDKDQDHSAASTVGSLGDASETSGTTQVPTKKRSGLERLVRGLDSALDFVTT